MRPLIPEIVGSHPIRGMDVCLLYVLCVVRADHSSEEVLPNVVCLGCDGEASIMRHWPTGGCCVMGEILTYTMEQSPS